MYKGGEDVDIPKFVHKKVNFWMHFSRNFCHPFLFLAFSTVLLKICYDYFPVYEVF